MEADAQGVEFQPGDTRNGDLGEELTVAGFARIGVYLSTEQKAELEARAAIDNPVVTGDNPDQRIPPISKTIRVGDKIVSQEIMQAKKELVCDYDDRLAAAARVIAEVTDAGVFTTTNVFIPMDKLNESYRYYMTRKMVTIGDIVTDASKYLYEVIKTGDNEIRLRPENWKPGMADAHPGWITFARYHYTFVRRKKTESVGTSNNNRLLLVIGSSYELWSSLKDGATDDQIKHTLMKTAGSEIVFAGKTDGPEWMVDIEDGGEVALMRWPELLAAIRNVMSIPEVQS